MWVAAALFIRRQSANRRARVRAAYARGEPASPVGSTSLGFHITMEKNVPPALRFATSGPSQPKGDLIAMPLQQLQRLSLEKSGGGTETFWSRARLVNDH